MTRAMLTCVALVCLCAAFPPVAPAAEDITSVEAQPPPESSFRQSAAFTLSEAQPTYQYEFVATRKGPHTAVVKCEGDGVAVLRAEPEGGKAAQAKGTKVVGVTFQAAAGTNCAISVELEDPEGQEVTGQLALFLGTGKEAMKLVPSSEPLGSFTSVTPPEGRKDLLVPLTIRLAERYLADAPDKTELDYLFADRLSRSSKLTRPKLKRIVDDYRRLPDDEKDARYVDLTPGRPALAPITREDLRLGLNVANPAFELALNCASEEAAGERSAGLARIHSVEPASLAQSDADGAKITLHGLGIPVEAEDLLVQLWPDAPGARKPAHSLVPTAATHDYLTFDLPKGLKAGRWGVNLVTGKAASNRVTLSIGQGKTSLASQPAITGVARGYDDGVEYLYFRGANFQQAGGMNVNMTMSYPTGPLTVSLPADILSDQMMRARIEDQIRDATQVDLQVIGEGKPYLYTDPVRYVYNNDTPRFRVYFTEMECLDESYPEDVLWGAVNCSDTLVTTWIVVADGTAYCKRSRDYEDFDDGDEKDYFPVDGWVMPLDGYENWQPIQGGMMLCTELYEWDAGDLDTAVEIIDEVGRICSYVAGFFLPTGGSYAVTAVFEVIKAGADCWFGYWSRPDPLGECTEAFSQADLLAMFGSTRGKGGLTDAFGQNTYQSGFVDSLDDGWLDWHPGEGDPDYTFEKVTRQIQFLNGEDTGSYQLRYEVHHLLAWPPSLGEVPR